MILKEKKGVDLQQNEIKILLLFFVRAHEKIARILPNLIIIIEDFENLLSLPKLHNLPK